MPPSVEMSTLTLPALVAFAVALLITPLVRLLALRLGAVDATGPRRTHARSVPRLGGVALLAALVAAFVACRFASDAPLQVLTEHGWSLAWLALATAAMATIGIVDDVRGLGVGAKLAGQLLAAGLVTAGGYGFATVTNPLTGGLIELGAFGVVFSLGWILLITNAFNLIDGLDGLATGIGLIACVTIALVATAQGRPDVVVLAVVFGAALLGFLPHNFHPASIFLGDSGSLLIGFWLALLAMHGLQKGPTLIMVLVPVFALGVPLLDTGISIVRRYLVAGWAAVFRADKDHVHHRLLALGLTHRNAVLTLYVVATVFGGFAFLSMWISGPANAVLLMLVGAATFILVRKFGYGRGAD